MTGMTITTQDMRTLLDLSHPRHQVESIESVWESALSAVRSVVPCDAVSFQIQDVAHRRMLEVRELVDRYELYADPDDPEDEFYWSVFWSSHCSYPQRSGDYRTVTKPTDFESTRELMSSPTGEMLRASGMRHEVMVPLPVLGPLDYRMCLWRADRRDFSERDMLLLSIIRPHLVAIRDATFKHEPDIPRLTARQRQLLSLVATGLTNRQVARHLGVSEHTVRKHVENIFERLHVTSRTAAVTRAFPGNPPV